jgi:acrosin
MAHFWLRSLARQFLGAYPARRIDGAQRPRRRRPLGVERLEDRTTPSTLDFTNGVLSYTASSNVGSNFTLAFSGGTYTLSDTAETITVTQAAQNAGFTGSGTNTVTGPDSTSLTSLQITLGNPADTANIRSLSKPTTLTTGAGSDTINVSSTGLTGNLNGIGASLSIDAGGGANTLNVSNYTATSGDSNVVIGSSSITGFAGPSGSSTINYTATGGTFSLLHVLGSNTPTLSQGFTVNNPNATTFQLNANNGTNTINVEAISGAATITGGLGKDSIVVCSNPNLSGSLDGINGTLTIDGGQGVNSLTVSDAGTTGTANNAVITNTQMLGLAGAGNNQVINYKAIGGSFGQITVVGAASASLGDQLTVNNPNGPLALDLGAGADTVNVQSLSKAATINGGSGNDTFNVSSDAPTNQGTLNNINGTLTVNAGTGANVLDVSDYGQTSLTDNVTVTPTSITGFAGSSKGTAINYGGTFSSVILTGSHTDANTFNVSGSTVAVLQGGNGNDTFSLANGAGAKSIDGGAGTNTLSYAAYTSNVNVTLTNPSGTNGYQSASATGLASGFANIGALTAGSGSNNVLTGENVASTWTLGSSAQTYNDGGSTSLTFSGFQTLDAGSGGDTFNVNANTTANLNGGSGNDTFNLAKGVALTGAITGGSGSDTLSYAAYTSAVSVTLSGSDSTGLSSTSATGVSSFKGIDVLVGGQGSSDSLTGENVAGTWALGGTNTYSDGSHSLTFSAFETVNAGTAGDTFNIGGATDVNTANGGAGNDTFNIGGNAALNLSDSAGSNAFNFTKDGAVLTGTITGGSGIDTLSYAGYKATAVSVTLTGSDATGLKSTSATGVTSFKGINAIVGGQGSSDSLTGENVASTWALGSTNTYSDGSHSLTFSAFETVNAGTAGDTFNINGTSDVPTANGGSGNDTFNINANATLNLSDSAGSNAFDFTKDGIVLTGTITGGSGTDTLSYAGYKATAVSVTLTGSDATGLKSTSATGVTSFKDIDAIVGGQGSSDSLTGENVASNWALGSTNTYSDGSATLTFSAFETVNAGTAGDTFNIGGTGDVTTANGGSGNDTFNINHNATLNLSGNGGGDTFNVADGVTLTGSIDGGTGSDTLSYAAYKSAVDVVLGGSSATTGFSSGNATGVSSFAGIDVLVGGQAATNTLTGENAVNTWDLGTTQDYRDGTATLTFSNFEQLVGGSAADMFNITSGSTPVTSINGGDGNNVFNFSASATMSLTGGKDNDTFNIGDGVTLTGSIDGGAGSNTLSYAKDTAKVTVLLTSSAANGYASSSGSTGVSSFQNINVIVGGKGSSDTLTGESINNPLNGASINGTWTIGATQTYNDGTGHGSVTFSGFEVLDSGTDNDTFNVTQTTANVPLSLNGGGGNVTFNVSNLANVLGDFTVNGGSGSSSLNVDDSANTTAVAWLIDGSTVQQFNAGAISYGNLATITVATGTPAPVAGTQFSNALDVEAVPAGTSLTIQASQTDVIVAQITGTLANIQGGLTIDAVGKNVTVTINDSATQANTNYTINGTTGTVSTDNVSISILESPTQLTVLGGSGTNNFDVTPSPTYQIVVDGGVNGASTSTLTYHYGSSTTAKDLGGIITDPGVVQDVIYTDFGTVKLEP